MYCSSTEHDTSLSLNIPSYRCGSEYDIVLTLHSRYEAAYADFLKCAEKMKNNMINYNQLGLTYKLHACQVLTQTVF